MIEGFGAPFGPFGPIISRSHDEPENDERSEDQVLAQAVGINGSPSRSSVVR